MVALKCTSLESTHSIHINHTLSSIVAFNSVVVTAKLIAAIHYEFEFILRPRLDPLEITDKYLSKFAELELNAIFPVVKFPYDPYFLSLALPPYAWVAFLQIKNLF